MAVIDDVIDLVLELDHFIDAHDDPTTSERFNQMSRFAGARWFDLDDTQREYVRSLTGSLARARARRR